MLSKFLYVLTWICLPLISLSLSANGSIETNESDDIRVGTIYNTTEILYHHYSLPTSILLMIDGSTWEIVNPPMVKRTPDSKEPLFCFHIEDWEKPFPVAIDSIQWILDNDFDNEEEDSAFNYVRGHKDLAAEFPYIIENRETGKYTFARPILEEEIRTR